MSTLFRPCDASKSKPEITCIHAAATVALPEPAPVAASPSVPQASSSLQLDRIKEDYEGLPVAHIMDVLCIFWKLETLIAAMKCVNFCALDKVGYSQRRAANCLAKNQHSQAGSRKKLLLPVPGTISCGKQPLICLLGYRCCPLQEKLFAVQRFPESDLTCALPLPVFCCLSQTLLQQELPNLEEWKQPEPQVLDVFASRDVAPRVRPHQLAKTLLPLTAGMKKLPSTGSMTPS
jgi:hypothetical protein